MIVSQTHIQELQGCCVIRVEKIQVTEQIDTADVKGDQLSAFILNMGPLICFFQVSSQNSMMGGRLASGLKIGVDLVFE